MDWRRLAIRTLSPCTVPSKSRCFLRSLQHLPALLLTTYTCIADLRQLQPPSSPSLLPGNPPNRSTLHQRSPKSTLLRTQPIINHPSPSSHRRRRGRRSHRPHAHLASLSTKCVLILSSTVPSPWVNTDGPPYSYLNDSIYWFLIQMSSTVCPSSASFFALDFYHISSTTSSSNQRLGVLPIHSHFEINQPRLRCWERRGIRTLKLSIQV
ncbi:unnamed protein product [Lactuca saligna]|uniref:Uncharacterized protein n=1 Tax=Lactuca saligna TaxID=75948 RepID=A0AA36A238_LACSI|nr:unnamed protein product [Lactuca saligna]